MIFTAHLTDRGGREINEDSYDIITNGQQICAVVADGLGGHGGGDVASSMTVSYIRKYVETNQLPITAEGLNTVVQEVNEMIYEQQTAQCKMKTTLAVLVTDETSCFWAHVGDTRIYHFVNGQYLEMTFDHSVSQMAVLTGEISQDQVRHHVDRNKLLRAIGNQDDVRVEFSTTQDVSNEFHAFLLCTDGFWEYVNEDEMEETLQNSVNPTQWIEQMHVILKSRVPDNHDNNTAVAIWVAKDE